MIYRLSPAYLERLKSQKNWAVFAGYVIAMAVAAVLAQKYGLRATPLGLAGLVVAGAHHWYRTHIHQQVQAEAKGVEVEVVERSLVWRTDAGTHTFPINSLNSIIYQPRYATIELRFKSDECFILRGVNDAEKLADELEEERRFDLHVADKTSRPGAQQE